jgi:hypothetical protein
MGVLDRSMMASAALAVVMQRPSSFLTKPPASSRMIMVEGALSLNPLIKSSAMMESLVCTQSDVDLPLAKSSRHSRLVSQLRWKIGTRWCVRFCCLPSQRPQRVEHLQIHYPRSKEVCLRFSYWKLPGTTSTPNSASSRSPSESLPLRRLPWEARRARLREDML